MTSNSLWMQLHSEYTQHVCVCERVCVCLWKCVWEKERVWVCLKKVCVSARVVRKQCDCVEERESLGRRILSCCWGVPTTTCPWHTPSPSGLPTRPPRFHFLSLGSCNIQTLRKCSEAFFSALSLTHIHTFLHLSKFVMNVRMWKEWHSYTRSGFLHYCCRRRRCRNVVVTSL